MDKPTGGTQQFWEQNRFFGEPAHRAGLAHKIAHAMALVDDVRATGNYKRQGDTLSADDVSRAVRQAASSAGLAILPPDHLHIHRGEMDYEVWYRFTILDGETGAGYHTVRYNVQPHTGINKDGNPYVVTEALRKCHIFAQKDFLSQTFLVTKGGGQQRSAPRQDQQRQQQPPPPTGQGGQGQVKSEIGDKANGDVWRVQVFQTERGRGYKLYSDKTHITDVWERKLFIEAGWITDADWTEPGSITLDPQIPVTVIKTEKGWALHSVEPKGLPDA